MNSNELIAEGIKRAQKVAREQGLKIGTIVAHPSDRLTYKLYKLEGGVAHVGLEPHQSPTRKSISKTFPADEIFDVNVALEEAKAFRDERLARLTPGAVVVRLGR